MKILSVFGTLFFALVLLFSSCQKEIFDNGDNGGSSNGNDSTLVAQKMEFITDCTGDYLRLNGKDYHVCNSDQTKEFMNGDVVMASFIASKECATLDSSQLTCKMYHANEGWVNVIAIKLLYRPTTNPDFKVENVKMKVVIDCSGFYLQYNNEDYRVCNFDALNDFKDGEWVIASMYQLKECVENSDKVFCKLYHPNKGVVKAYGIQKIDDSTVDPSKTSCKLEIIKDCTGTYVRWNEKDYQVCNFELLEKFKGGEVIEAKFYRLKECNNPLLKDMVFCTMYHQNEGWVKVWF